MSDEWNTDMMTAPRDGRKLLLLFDGPFFDSLETGHAIGMWTGDSWWLTCIWASSDARRPPIAWCHLPAA